MTEEEKKAVETAEAEAAAAAANEPTELEKALAEKDAMLVKLAAERDNYKKGMLKAKGKVSKNEDDDSEEETVDEKVTRLVKEQLLDTQFDLAQKEKDALILKTLARNKELETALKNRSQIATAGAGSSSETKLAPADPVLTAEKLSQLKGLGWDDKKIELFKKNLMKTK